MKCLLPSLLWVCLSACAPATQTNRLDVETVVTARSFYPHETGLKWHYLEPGERTDTPSFTKEVVGPTLVNGELLTLSRVYGRGQDTKLFERFDDSGVYLVREDRPASIFVYSPPMQTLPPSSELRVGTVWQGTSQVNVYYPDATVYRDPLTIDYHFQVIDLRQVRVLEHTFEVYVISFQATQTLSSGSSQGINQEIWYTPYIGEIKTRTNVVLTEVNFDVTAKPHLARAQ
jgi:hypothetical protein